MKITVEAGSACRIMLFLAIRGVDNKVGARIISENEHVTIRFTLKILRKLKLAGLLISYRGQNGGYSIAKNPSDITFKDIIEAIDGPISLKKCLGEEECKLNRKLNCPIHHYLSDVNDIIIKSLDSINLQMCIDKYNACDEDIITFIKEIG